MAVSTQHCTSMVGARRCSSNIIYKRRIHARRRRRCSSSNIIYKRRIHARAAAAAKMLATLTVGECSARRGQILPRDGGEQQQQQHSAVTGSSSARGLQYFCEQHSD